MHMRNWACIATCLASWSSNVETICIIYDVQQPTGVIQNEIYNVKMPITTSHE